MRRKRRSLLQERAAVPDPWMDTPAVLLPDDPCAQWVHISDYYLSSRYFTQDGPFIHTACSGDFEIIEPCPMGGGMSHMRAAAVQTAAKIANQSEGTE